VGSFWTKTPVTSSKSSTITEGRAWPVLASIHTIVFDFDGVFTDNTVMVDQDGVESVRCSRADGLAIDMLRASIDMGKLKAEMFILSREANPVVKARAEKLKLEYRYNSADKKGYMDAYLAQRFPRAASAYQGVVFLANDLNDLELIGAAGFSVVPEDAHPMVKESASTTLPRRGGDGFVRLFVERLLNVAEMRLESIYELVRHR